MEGRGIAQQRCSARGVSVELAAGVWAGRPSLGVCTPLLRGGLLAVVSPVVAAAVCWHRIGHSSSSPPPCLPCSCPPWPLAAQVRAQELRRAYRSTASTLGAVDPETAADLEALRDNLPLGALVDNGDSLRLPFTKEGLRMAVLNAER